MNRVILNLFNKLMEEKINRLSLEYIEAKELWEKSRQEVDLANFNYVDGKIKAHQEVSLLLAEVLG